MFRKGFKSKYSGQKSDRKEFSFEGKKRGYKRSFRGQRGQQKRKNKFIDPNKFVKKIVKFFL